MIKSYSDFIKESVGPDSRDVISADMTMEDLYKAAGIRKRKFKDNFNKAVKKSNAVTEEYLDNIFNGDAPDEALERTRAKMKKVEKSHVIEKPDNFEYIPKVDKTERKSTCVVREYDTDTNKKDNESCKKPDCNMRDYSTPDEKEKPKGKGFFGWLVSLFSSEVEESKMNSYTKSSEPPLPPIPTARNIIEECRIGKHSSKDGR